MNTLNFIAEEISFAKATRVQPRLAKPISSFLVNGSPKTGTTWMCRLLGSLPGYRRIGNLQRNLDAFRVVQPGSVIHGHETYSVDLSQILQTQKISVVLMIRDPRDQAVSRMYHVLRDKNEAGHEFMMQLDPDEALMYSINGTPGKMIGVVQSLEFTRRWLESELHKSVVKYEHLQAHPVRILHDVLSESGLEVSDQLVEAIIYRNNFERLSRGRKFWQNGRKQGEADSTSHFRKGIVGDWRNHFSEIHINRFKELAGETLIELGYESGYDW